MGLLERALRNGFRGCIHSTSSATALGVVRVTLAMRVRPPLGSVWEGKTMQGVLDRGLDVVGFSRPDVATGQGR